MGQIKSLRLGFLVCILSIAVPSFGTVIDLSTATPSNWIITGGGSGNAPAFPYPHLSGITITSTGDSSGTFAAGGSISKFSGFWYGDALFQLPANATSVSLAFSGLQGDDRVALQMNNGPILGDYFLNGTGSNPPLVGPGVMSFLPGPPDVSYTFTGKQSGTVSAGFAIGGLNDLRLIVNNTDRASLTASTIGLSGGDSTHAEVVASVSYLTPEPSSPGLLGIGLVGLMLRRRIGLRR